MRPLIEDEWGSASSAGKRSSTRTVRRNSGAWQQKDPVAHPLRHKGPIRELTFFDEANLLITPSDESVKVWDALTGEPRKELERQTIRPMWLSFAPNPGDS